MCWVSNSMRVFHVSPNVYPPLPAGHHTLRIWKELARNAERYHVIASAGRLRYSHTVDGNLHLHLLPTFGTRGWHFFLASWMVLFLCLRHHPDRIIAQCPVNGGLVASVARLIFRVPVLAEVHGAHYFWPGGPGGVRRVTWMLLRLGTAFTFRVATRIRSLSRDMTEHLVRVYGESIQPKIFELGNRVDLELFSPVKTCYRMTAGPTLISVGAYTAGKNHLALVEGLLQRLPDARLTLVGRGPMERVYVERAQALGVQSRLKLVHAASHRDVASLLAESDIYIHPSLSEGVPRAILEAMAMGLPVVATKVGFLGGVVRDGVDVSLIPLGDLQALERAVDRLIDSEDLRREMGTAAAKQIRSRFEWNSTFDRYRGLIASLVRA
jgi:glycosyltransferase involved in cell wall biosynthesis